MIGLVIDEGETCFVWESLGWRNERESGKAAG
jgi:hypothetical protein